MSYAKYYLQARDASDRILDGTWQTRTPVKIPEGSNFSAGLMSRKQATEQPKSTYEDMILGRVVA